MDRKEFLEMCRSVAVLPNHSGGIKEVPSSLLLKCQDMTFYPIGYKLTYTGNGTPCHTAILRDLKAYSVVECDLLKVSKME